MARLNLIINPSDFAAVLKPFVKTRKRTVFSAVVSSLIALGTGFGVIYYVLNVSSYPTLNLFLILLITFLILPSALFQTILIGDLFFSKNWRHTTFVDTESPSTVIRDHNLEFTVIFALMFVGQALLLNFGGGNFIRTYNEETFFYVKYRDADPKVREWALGQLASPFRYSSWQRPGVQKLIMKSLTDPSPEVQAMGCYLVGFIGIPGGREELLEIVRSPHHSAKAKGAAAIALPELGATEETRQALEGLVGSVNGETAQGEGENPAVVGALRGLAKIQSALSTPVVLERAKKSLGTEVGRNALFALQKLPSDDVASWARGEIEKSDAHDVQCQLYDLLKFVGKDEDVSWARLQFLKPFSAEMLDPCQEVVWEEADETKHYISYGDTIPVKLVKIVANRDGGKQRAWFERLMRDRNQPEDVREIAGQVLKQLGE